MKNRVLVWLLVVLGAFSSLGCKSQRQTQSLVELQREMSADFSFEEEFSSGPIGAPVMIDLSLLQGVPDGSAVVVSSGPFGIVTASRDTKTGNPVIQSFGGIRRSIQGSQSTKESQTDRQEESKSRQTGTFDWTVWAAIAAGAVLGYHVLPRLIPFRARNS